MKILNMNIKKKKKNNSYDDDDDDDDDDIVAVEDDDYDTVVDDDDNDDDDDVDDVTQSYCNYFIFFWLVMFCILFHSYESTELITDSLDENKNYFDDDMVLIFFEM